MGLSNQEISEIEANLIENVLTTVMDPEIEIDIVNLGLIYDLKYDGGKKIDILMTMSTPTCPLSDTIIQNVEETIKQTYPDFNVEVELTFEPRWHAGLISERGKEVLGM